MALFNQNWIGLDGEPITGKTPPRMTVRSETPGAVLSPAQEGVVAHAYKLFCDTVRVSTFPKGYHVQNRRYPDGMTVRMSSLAGVTDVQVTIRGGGSKPERPKIGIGLQLWRVNNYFSYMTYDAMLCADGKPIDGNTDGAYLKGVSDPSRYKGDTHAVVVHIPENEAPTADNVTFSLAHDPGKVPNRIIKKDGFASGGKIGQVVVAGAILEFPDALAMMNEYDPGLVLVDFVGFGLDPTLPCTKEDLRGYAFWVCRSPNKWGYAIFGRAFRGSKVGEKLQTQLLVEAPIGDTAAENYFTLAPFGFDTSVTEGPTSLVAETAGVMYGGQITSSFECRVELSPAGPALSAGMTLGYKPVQEAPPLPVPTTMWTYAHTLVPFTGSTNSYAWAGESSTSYREVAGPTKVYVSAQTVSVHCTGASYEATVYDEWLDKVVAPMSIRTWSTSHTKTVSGAMEQQSVAASWEESNVTPCLPESYCERGVETGNQYGRYGTLLSAGETPTAAAARALADYHGSYIHTAYTKTVNTYDTQYQVNYNYWVHTVSGGQMVTATSSGSRPGENFTVSASASYGAQNWKFLSGADVVRVPAPIPDTALEWDNLLAVASGNQRLAGILTHREWVAGMDGVIRTLPGAKAILRLKARSGKTVDIVDLMAEFGHMPLYGRGGVYGQSGPEAVTNSQKLPSVDYAHTASSPTEYIGDAFPLTPLGSPITGGIGPVINQVGPLAPEGWELAVSSQGLKGWAGHHTFVGYNRPLDGDGLLLIRDYNYSQGIASASLYDTRYLAPKFEDEDGSKLFYDPRNDTYVAQAALSIDTDNGWKIGHRLYVGNAHGAIPLEPLLEAWLAKLSRINPDSSKTPLGIPLPVGTVATYGPQYNTTICSLY